MVTRPLDGTRILDLTRLLPGPFCSMLLAGLGADVIKVEHPDGGDPVRGIEARLGGSGRFHGFLNRGKRSLALDLKAPEGRELLLRMAARADVLLESFRPGVAERLGIGYEAVAARNARLVYCSLTAYGAEGERAGRAGHDVNFLAVAGVLDQIRGADGTPVIPGIQIADVGAAAMPGVQAILAALLARERDGRGQRLVVSITHHLQAWLALERSLPAPADPRRRPTFGGRLPSYCVYATADGRHLTLGAVEPEFWRAFCEEVGRPGWIARQDDPALTDAVRALVAGRTFDEWRAVAGRIDACLEPVLDLGEAAAALGGRHRAAPGAELLPGVWFSRLAPAAGIESLPPAPAAGEHTRAILAEVGVEPEVVGDLADRGVIR